MRSNIWHDRLEDSTTRDALAGNATRQLVIVSASSRDGKKFFQKQLQCLDEIGYTYDSVHYLSKSRKFQLVSGGLYGRYYPVVYRHTTSMGMNAIMASRYLGADKIVFSGLSFRSKGYSYNDTDLYRKHVDDDREVMEYCVKNNHEIYTCDPDFAADTGLALFQE